MSSSNNKTTKVLRSDWTPEADLLLSMNVLRKMRFVPPAGMWEEIASEMRGHFSARHCRHRFNDMLNTYDKAMSWHPYMATPEKRTSTTPASSQIIDLDSPATSPVPLRRNTSNQNCRKRGEPHDSSCRDEETGSTQKRRRATVVESPGRPASENEGTMQKQQRHSNQDEAEFSASGEESEEDALATPEGARTQQIEVLQKVRKTFEKDPDATLWRSGPHGSPSKQRPKEVRFALDVMKPEKHGTQPKASRLKN